MRPGQQNKRMRGRGRRGPSPLSRSYESNGPDVKIRGTASHIAEKYMQLARDAQTSGEMVSAENYFQHAEHYFRIIAAAQAQNQQQNPNEQQRSRPHGADDSDDDDDDTTPQQSRDQNRDQGRDQNRDQNRGQGPQPSYQPQPPAEQPAIEQPQPSIPATAAGSGDKGAEPGQPDAAADQANGNQPPKRRRRRAAPAAAQPDVQADTPPAESASKGGNGSGDAQPSVSEEPKAEKPKAERLKAEQPGGEASGKGPDENLLTAGDA